MPMGIAAAALTPLLLPLPFLMQLAPPVLLVAAFALGMPTLALWATIATGVSLATWLAYYRAVGLPMAYALLFPLGAAVTLYIAVTAVIRGSRVEWKGREYESANPANV